MNDPLYEILSNAVGEENISNQYFELMCYSRDSGSSFPGIPEYVILPETSQQISRVVQIANRYRKPIIPRGAGSSVCGAPIPTQGGIVIDMTKMNKLVNIDEDSMTVTVQAGITWTEMLYELAKRGFETGLEGPWSAPSATVGGSISVNAICIGAAKYGAIGNEVVGLEVVLPDGNITRTGSAANPACATVERYCNGADLTGLFIGSHGTLGIITEVTLRLYSIHEADAYLAFSFDDVKSLSNALRMLIRNGIAYDGRTFIRPIPSQIEGKTGMVLWLRGGEKEIEVLSNKARKLASDAGGREVHDFGEKYYQERFTVRVKDFGKAGPGWLEVAGFVPITKYPQVVKAVLDMFERKKNELERLDIKWSLGGLLMKHSINVPFALFCNELNKNAWSKMHEYLKQVAELMYRMGVSPYWIGQLSPHIMWKLGAYYMLYRTIKEALDPVNIMNPGILYL